MSLFHGLSAFPITPSDDAGIVDTDNLGQLVARVCDAKVDSVGLLGSTGTYAYLTRAQRQRAVAAASEIVGDTPLIVGVGALRTNDVIDLAKDAQAAGADALLLAPVSYTPLTQEEALTHYTAVAASTDLPICIYNNPGTTHFSFDLSLLQQLAAVPNIAAVKMPLPAGDLGDDLAQLRASLPADFAIGYSGDWGCGDALLAGADSWYSVLGGILPKQALALTRAAQASDADATSAQNAALEPLWALFKEHGSLRVAYTIAHHLNLTTALPPRPILPLGSEAEARVVAALGALDL